MPVDNQVRLWIKSGIRFSTSISCGLFADNNKFQIPRWFLATLSMIVLIAFTSLLTASAIKPGWVVPGGTVSAVPGVLGNESTKFCALTFDDGPDETFTAQIQTILDFYGVKATFFVVGNQAEERLEQVVAMHAAGHEIANHSYTHADFAKLSSLKRQSELTQLNDLLKPLGITPTWFRPPYGAYNKATVQIAANQGMEAVLWTLDPKDWTLPGVEVIRQRVLSQTSSGEVILLHSTNAQTVAALPGIIDGLREQGYRFVTLSAWREIVTGKLNVPAPIPIISSPDSVPFSQVEPPAISILSQVSKAAQSLIAKDPKHTSLNGTQPGESLNVYSNFKDPAGCTELHKSKRSKGNFTYHSVAPACDEFFTPLELPHPEEDGHPLDADLYYHGGYEPGADTHDSP